MLAQRPAARGLHFEAPKHVRSRRTFHSIRPISGAPYITETDRKTGSKRVITLKQGALSVSGNTTVEPQNGAVAAVRAFFLPQGWPGSASPDYLRYQLFTFPSHVTGWMSSSLAGSSMLKALGVGVGPAGAVGFSAAIKWVIKDGVGAAGRLFVGGQLSKVFDEDPKRWRMIAEAVTTVGLALEIATQLSPANFIALAGAGTLAKATGKGMGRPCFRVMHVHFAIANNVGDVAAKEEVWEVAAQMIGLALSVALLSALEVAGTPEVVVPVWAVVQSVHVALRYTALRQLCFPWPNMKRGAALVRRNVADGSVLTVQEANFAEEILAGPDVAGLRCILGCSLEEATGDRSWQLSSESSMLVIEEGALEGLLWLYRDESYILTRRGGMTYVVLWEDAGGLDMMRALWQAAWLQDRIGGADAGMEELQSSLEVMRERFPGLERRAAAEGWELKKTTLPLGTFRLAESTSP